MVVQALRWVRSQVRGVHAHTLIWTLMACSATFCLLRGMRNGNQRSKNLVPSAGSTEGEVSDRPQGHCKEEDKRDQGEEEEEEIKSGAEEDEAEGEDKDRISEDEEDDRMER